MARAWGKSVAIAAVAVVAIGSVFWASSLADGDAADPAATQSASPSSTPSRPATSPALTPSLTPSPLPSEAPLAWGPTQTDWDAALATARSLPVARAAGQVIVASYAGTSPVKLSKMIDKYGLGGVMLQGDATSSKKVTTKLTAAAASAGRTVPVGNGDWPVMIAVDQEGGTVARLRGMMPDLPGLMAAGAATNKSMVQETYAIQGAHIVALGFNTDFAPDADVTAGLSDPVIRTRSAGSDPQNVASTVDAVLAGYTDAGLISTVKHFPGHGSVDVDSHLGLPVQSLTVAELEKRDLIPFASAVDAGAPAVMLGHIALAEWGGDAASLSPGAYTYLRERLGFTGVAITDAMNMGAIVDHHQPGEATVLALEAGADMVLMPADTGAALRAIVAAVDAGDLPRARLDEAAARSILLMRWQAGQIAEPIPLGSDGYARDFAARSATMVTPSCHDTVFTGKSSKVTISGGAEHERAVLAKALAAWGVTAGDKSEPGVTVRLVGNSSKSASADVVVSLAGPWVLDKASATTYIELYGRSDDVLEGLADVLTANTVPQSAWPVKLGNVLGATCE